MNAAASPVCRTAPPRWRATRVIGVMVALLTATASTQAQQPRAAVVPEAITVGDVFRAAVQLDIPADAVVGAPDSLSLPADLEHAGRREIRIDTAGGGRRATVIYPLTAWRPGSYDLPAITLRVVADGSDRSIEVRFPSFDVRSVLPEDTTGIEPKEAKDVIGANRIWWPILLALLLAAAIAIGLYYWWRRRRKPVPEPLPLAPRIHPRAAALAQLEALRRSGLIERGALKPFYAEMTEALRQYTATLRPTWGVDLTTTELSGRMMSNGTRPKAVELVRILGTADLVKFARAHVPAHDAWRDLDAALLWVEQAEPRDADSGTEDMRVA
ncbi:hypothetical protein BH23GEM9_BH23GEM9_10640 [soil metagenome]